MTQNKKAIFYIVGGVAVYLLIMAAVSAASFARAGGTANVLSHSNDVQIEADSVGDVVSVTGNGNALQYQPETEQHKRGESVMLWLWGVLFIALVLFLFNRMGVTLVWEKSV